METFLKERLKNKKFGFPLWSKKYGKMRLLKVGKKYIFCFIDNDVAGEMTVIQYSFDGKISSLPTLNQELKTKHEKYVHNGVTIEVSCETNEKVKTIENTPSNNRDLYLNSGFTE